MWSSCRETRIATQNGVSKRRCASAEILARWVGHDHLGATFLPGLPRHIVGNRSRAMHFLQCRAVDRDAISPMRGNASEHHPFPSVPFSSPVPSALCPLPLQAVSFPQRDAMETIIAKLLKD